MKSGRNPARKQTWLGSKLIRVSHLDWVLWGGAFAGLAWAYSTCSQLQAAALILQVLYKHLSHLMLCHICLCCIGQSKSHSQPRLEGWRNRFHICVKAYIDGGRGRIRGHLYNLQDGFMTSILQKGKLKHGEFKSLAMPTGLQSGRSRIWAQVVYLWSIPLTMLHHLSW